MIVPIVGNVTYTITLDPTVWIFDERKILLEEAFKERVVEEKQDHLQKNAERFNREVFQHSSKPPINPSISRKEGNEILKNSYVMPIEDFINNAEVTDTAKDVTLITSDDENNINMSLDDFKKGLLLFALNGKPLKEDGPVHFYNHDGSNKDNPIKNIKKIQVN